MALLQIYQDQAKTELIKEAAKSPSSGDEEIFSSGQIIRPQNKYQSRTQQT